MKIKSSFSTIILTSVTLLFSSGAFSDDNFTRLLLNFKGTGTAVSRAVPDNTGMDLSSNGMLDSNCFEADVFDLKTGRKLGSAEDCLSEIAVDGATGSGSGVQVVGTTIFNLHQGRLVIQGLTSVQPVNWPTKNIDGNEFTHITGANSPRNAVLNGIGEFRNTRRFKNVEATVRLSGLVNLDNAPVGEITFDCIFVVDIKRYRKNNRDL